MPYVRLYCVYRSYTDSEGGRRVEIVISNASDQPIYEQIVRQIKDAIISGALAPGAPLPSIRALAKDLRISVITTRRAYDELERDGFVNTVAGKGSFVAEQTAALAREARLREIESHMREIWRLAPPCGITGEAVIEWMRLIGKEESS